MGLVRDLVFRRLPVELVHDILRCAAIDFIDTNNLSRATELLLLSHDVNKLLVHIVYRTLCITRSNCDSLFALATGAIAGAGARPLAAVRRVFVTKELDDLDQAVSVLRACPNMRWMDADWTLLHCLEHACAGIELGRLALRFQALRLVTRLPRTFVQPITHLEGYHFPLSSNPPATDWVPSLVEALPHLTHVSIAVTGPGTVGRLLEEDDKADLLDVVRAFLSSPTPRVERIVIHLSGSRIELEDYVRKKIGLTLCDPRVHLWLDKRYFKTWVYEERQCAQDARHGLDVWAQGEQLWHAR